MLITNNFKVLLCAAFRLDRNYCGESFRTYRIAALGHDQEISIWSGIVQ